MEWVVAKGLRQAAAMIFVTLMAGAGSRTFGAPQTERDRMLVTDQAAESDGVREDSEDPESGSETEAKPSTESPDDGEATSPVEGLIDKGSNGKGVSGNGTTLSETHPDSPFTLRWGPSRPRSDLFMPAVSFLLPGLDQWIEGQAASALTYSGVAWAGAMYARDVYRNDHVAERIESLKNETASEDKKEIKTIDQRDEAYRKYLLGSLIYQGAGGFSAYHSFRTAVRSRQHQGQYQFLTTEEGPGELLAAPFRFAYLKRPSTYVPLAIGAALAGLRLSSSPAEGYTRDKLRSSDMFFTGAYSYNAGTHEEAVFRGWLMPFAAEYTGSPFWANVSQSLIFALAHLGSNPTPLPQLLLGYHLGNVVQQDQWRLGEAIFIHVWWDVLAFASTYSYKEVSKNTQALSLVPVFWLPPLEVVF